MQRFPKNAAKSDDGGRHVAPRRRPDNAKPESACFFAVDEGKRGAVLIVNMNDTSEIPKFAEPSFLYRDATVKFSPAMAPQDLEKAGLAALSAKWK